MVSNETIGKVIVGDSDSLIFLGGEAQGELRDFSKSLANITLRDNDQIELLIEEIIIEMDRFSSEQEKNNPVRWFKSRSRNRSTLIRKYDHLLAYLDQVSIALQLQEAQLLKDNALLKSIRILLCKTGNELDQCIRKGKELLKKPLYCSKEDSATIFFEDSTYENVWKKRLEKRIEDLAISHTLSLQMLAQIDLMRENNTQLIERISSALSGTIPIWISQITLILGIEDRRNGLDVQRKLEQISSALISSETNIIAKLSHGKGMTREYNTSELIDANHSLQDSLRSLAEVEQNDKLLRLETAKALGNNKVTQEDIHGK